MIADYKHISFDLDGTLVYTRQEYRHELVPRVIRKCGGVIPESMFIDKFWFESERDAVIEEHFRLDSYEFWQAFWAEDDAEERASFTLPFDDVVPIFSALQSGDKKISIITDAPEWIAKLEAERIENFHLVDAFLPLSLSSFGRKPEPGGMFHVLDRLQLTPRETLYIGNSRGDAEFARNAGVDFIYIDRKEYAHPEDGWFERKIHSLHELVDGAVS